MIGPATPLALPRFARGTGLGNRLFIWARCRAWCYRTGAQPISPRWFRPALGPALRLGLQDALNTSLLGCFEAAPWELNRWQGWWLTLGRRRLPEQQLEPGTPIPGNSLVLFDQPHYSFAGLNEHWRRLQQDLLGSTRACHRRRVAAVAPALIGLHVRCGDGFQPPPADADDFGWVGWLQQTPIAWFVETVQQLRAAVGHPLPVLVVSDGQLPVLQPLLALPQVQLLRPSNTIVDLWALARCPVMLGSGSSSFSAWAAFLGQSHALTAPGHPFTRWGLEPQRGQVVAPHNPRDPRCSLPAPLLRDLADRLPSAGRLG